MSSINLAEYVIDPYTSNAKIDYKSLGEDIPYIVSAMDMVLEENIERHALPEQKEMARKYRNIGIGIMGLADMFVKLGITYGSDESVGITKNVMKYIFRQSVIASADRAKYYGNFPGYKECVWDSDIMKNAFTNEELEALKKNNYLRNCSLLSVAPTGSIGTMLNISTGVEPFFMLSYKRKTESLNKDQDTYYDVEVKAVEDYRKVSGNTGKLPDYFITSSEIHYKNRINIQAALQEFTDTAISSTINLPKETTIEDIKNLYIYAWEKGLKGITVYRDGSRDPILSKKESEPNPIKLPGVLPRGFIRKADDNSIGLKRTLMTGCGTLHCTAYFDPVTGELLETYLSKGSTGGCNNFMVGLSRMISLAARGGLGIDTILDQLKSCGTCPSYAVRHATKKDTSLGSCCPVAVGNALKQMYLEMQERIKHCAPLDNIDIKPMEEINAVECPECHSKTLIHSGGCVQCTNCGYSKCN